MLGLMKPNWFLALSVSAVGWFEERAGPAPEGIQGFDALDLHLTLAFLGSCGPEGAAEAFAASSDWGVGALDVGLGEVVPMGPPERYSALSILLTEGREEVEREMGRVRGRWLEIAGARPDRRPPKAHITIARPLRLATDPQREAALQWASALDFSGVGLSLQRLALYTRASDRKLRRFDVARERCLN